jgi:hypothetical protein
MSHNHMIRLAPLSDSDPLAARLAYYAYHGLRAIRDVVAEQGYVLSDYLVDLFDNQPMGLEPAEFAVVVLVPSIQLEWVASERDELTAAMDWLAEEYVRIVANACKKIPIPCTIRHHLKALLLTLMPQSPTSSRVEQPAPHPHPHLHPPHPPLLLILILLTPFWVSSRHQRRRRRPRPPPSSHRATAR